MTPERWQQIEELFQAAVEHAPETRSVFLQQASGEDIELCREVEKLLAADASTENATLALPAQIAAEWAQAREGVAEQQLLHYRVLSQLGAGGMGEVFRARDTKLNRDVAIKVLPAAFAADPERLARFTREAQILASLNHPNIAAIYGIEEPKVAGPASPSRRRGSSRCSQSSSFCSRRYSAGCGSAWGGTNPRSRRSSRGASC